MAVPVASAFGGFSYSDTKATGAGAKLPGPFPGRSVFLFNCAERKINSESSGERVIMSWTCLYQTELGKDPETTQNAAPQKPGDKVETLFFLTDKKGAKDRYHADLKRLSNSLAGIDDTQEKALADMLFPVLVEEGMDDETVAEVMANQKRFGEDDLARLNASGFKLLCMVTAQEGETAAFDNLVAIEIGTKKEMYHTLIDKKVSRDLESNWACGPGGVPLENFSTRSYINLRVPLTEIKEHVDDATAIKCFGSTKAWQTFCEYNDMGDED